MRLTASGQEPDPLGWLIPYAATARASFFIMAIQHAAEIQQQGEKDKQEQQEQGPDEAQQESSERFTCEFHDDFQDIGMLLDVDECGRLVVKEVSIG